MKGRLFLIKQSISVIPIYPLYHLNDILAYELYFAYINFVHAGAEIWPADAPILIRTADPHEMSCVSFSQALKVEDF